VDESGKVLRGVVHDPTARRMSGVAGHAGLFSTADDLNKFARALLVRDRILTPLLITKMTTPQQPTWSTDVRGLGWDIASPFANVRGDLLPAFSFGHTGYTGTSLWIDPTTQTYIILLTNSVHPVDGPDSWARVALRGKVANAVVSALSPDIDRRVAREKKPITSYTETMAGVADPMPRSGRVLNGIDVLEAESFASLSGKRIGLLTNQTGVDRNGNRTIDVLACAPGVKLVKLFSVEHGIAGTKDDENINDRVDAKTGLSIEGVYGLTPETRRPSATQLSGIDTLVIDIQDLGIRFYTYEASMAEFMSAAANNNEDVVILDRPNPLNGRDVQGPMTDEDDLWPNFNMRVPIRHGMTLGELAQMINSERKMGTKLRVIQMQGWSRGDWFDSTGLLWTNPSPNMRSLNAATLYPGVAQLEAQGSNVSVGRGTDTPFEIIGAPWISVAAAIQLAGYLNSREIPGVRFVARQFTPSSYIFANQACGGVNLIVTERNRLDSPLLGAELISALAKFFPNDFHADANRKLVGNKEVLDALNSGKDPKAVAIEWQEAIERFKETRAKYVIYK
jgi:uncharacterized protein YbbC (DUF1343 family)